MPDNNGPFKLDEAFRRMSNGAICYNSKYPKSQRYTIVPTPLGRLFVLVQEDRLTTGSLTASEVLADWYVADA